MDSVPRGEQNVDDPIDLAWMDQAGAVHGLPMRVLLTGQLLLRENVVRMEGRGAVEQGARWSVKTACRAPGRGRSGLADGVVHKGD